MRRRASGSMHRLRTRLARSCSIIWSWVLRAFSIPPSGDRPHDVHWTYAHAGDPVQGEGAPEFGSPRRRNAGLEAGSALERAERNSGSTGAGRGTGTCGRYPLARGRAPGERRAVRDPGCIRHGPARRRGSRAFGDGPGRERLLRPCGLADAARSEPPRRPTRPHPHPSAVTLIRRGRVRRRGQRRIGPRTAFQPTPRRSRLQEPGPTCGFQACSLRSASGRAAPCYAASRPERPPSCRMAQSEFV